MRTIEDIKDKNICINFGCVDEECRKCDLMCNPQCANYESSNTRQGILMSKFTKVEDQGVFLE